MYSLVNVQKIIKIRILECMGVCLYGCMLFGCVRHEGMEMYGCMFVWVDVCMGGCCLVVRLIA